MSFFDDIDSFVSSNFGLTVKEYKYMNIGGKLVYIEGQNGVLSLGSEEISFKLKHKIISVKGANLKIKYLDKNTVVIEGDISIVVVE